MDRYRHRIAMLSVGAQLGCPVRRRIEGEIDRAAGGDRVRDHPKPCPDRFFLSRVLQPFVVNLATVG